MPSAGDVIEAADVQIPGVKLGIVAITTATGNGTATSSTTETRDATLGNVTFTVAAAQASTRYRVTLSGRGLSITTGSIRYALNFRDGGASTPTATSTLVGVNFTVVNPTSGSNGTQAQTYSSTYVPGAGTHTISAFWVNVQGGTGAGTPTGACEFYVEALG